MVSCHRFLDETINCKANSACLRFEINSGNFRASRRDISVQYQISTTIYILSYFEVHYIPVLSIKQVLKDFNFGSICPTSLASLVSSELYALLL